MYLENQESVREKSGKSQGISFVKVCGNPVSGYEGLGTDSPCTSLKQSTDNLPPSCWPAVKLTPQTNKPPPSKRQKVSGTKTWWPPIVSESYKMHTVAWCPKNSAGKESGSNLGSLPPLTGVYVVKSAPPVTNSRYAITSEQPHPLNLSIKTCVFWSIYKQQWKTFKPIQRLCRECLSAPGSRTWLGAHGGEAGKEGPV